VEDLHSIFGDEKVHVDDRRSVPSKMGNKYAEFLKCKFQGNPQYTENAEQYLNTSTIT